MFAVYFYRRPASKPWQLAPQQFLLGLALVILGLAAATLWSIMELRQAQRQHAEQIATAQQEQELLDGLNSVTPKSADEKLVARSAQLESRKEYWASVKSALQASEVTPTASLANLLSVLDQTDSPEVWLNQITLDADHTNQGHLNGHASNHATAARYVNQLKAALAPYKYEITEVSMQRDDLYEAGVVRMSLSLRATGRP